MLGSGAGPGRERRQGQEPTAQGPSGGAGTRAQTGGWAGTTFLLEAAMPGESGNGYCEGCILTHLLWGDLAIFVEVQVFKQVGRRVLVPHKQVAFGQPLLAGYQLHLKQQHSTAGDPPGWREGEGKGSRSGQGLRRAQQPAQCVPSLQACFPSWRLESGTWGVDRTSRKGQTGGSDLTLPSPPLSPCARCGGTTSCRLSPTHMPCRPVSSPSITLLAPRVASWGAP